MPSFPTHYAFSEECLPLIPSGELSEAISAHPHAYRTGMQGPDMFLFYLPALLRKKRISTELHTRSTAALLTCLWRQAARSKGEARKIAFAYAAGFLGHYCLDSETHPFVYAFSGIDHTAECFCIHNALEADLNRLAVERTFEESIDALPLPDVYDLSEREKEVVARMLSAAIECVFKLSCSPAAVIRALGNVRLWCTMLYDPSGKKAKCFRLLERPFGKPYASPLFFGVSHYYPDAANLTHRLWRDPYTGETGRNDFFTLYDGAKDKFADALADLRTLPIEQYPAFFRALCKRDFHGEPKLAKKTARADDTRLRRSRRNPPLRRP